MKKLKIPTDYDYFVNPALGGFDYYTALVKGDDVTSVFRDDAVPPVKVIVIDKGEYADDLILEYTFRDEAHANDWLSLNETSDE
jgi:hypothetical protein